MSRPRERRTNISESWGTYKSKLSGWRVGRLTVVNIAERYNEKIYWLCICDCGEKTIAAQSDLKKGRVVSCGKPLCLYKAMLAEHQRANQ